MAKSENQKLKLLYLAKIFLEETDEEHGLSLQEITGKLETYGINVERKTLYADFDELRKMDLDIVMNKEGRTCYYHLLAGRDFELAEIKLLVDSVQSAKFITEKKSKELIKKLEGLVSTNQAKQLHRQVYIMGRVKTMNEVVYYNVDDIHAAIGKGVQITFKYYQWNVKKEMELRHNGEKYQVSPWGLIWDDEYYYLLGYDSESKTLRHYRVDKMLKVKVTDIPREGKKEFNKVDMALYTKKRFNMFDGEIEHVELLVDNSLAGVIIDRFGKTVMMVPKSDTHFAVYVDVAITGLFFGWVMSFGSGMKIVGPEDVVNKMKEHVKKVSDMYN